MPDLGRHDPCFETSQDYIPVNVTRRANLPPTDFTLIALAPWISAECTKSYLATARMDPARAFLFYLPNNGTSQPPLVNSPSWGLRDGGAWKTETPFPVYALSSNVGAQLMHQSSLYSGNMTSVPHGHDVSEMLGIDPRDYVRLYTQINLSNGSAWPGLWAFVLVIVAVFVLVLGFISAAMHVIQRARRTSLRRRVASGEVDLEALGIKRLTVPQEIIDKLPIFTYSCAGTSSLSVFAASKESQAVTGSGSHGSREGWSCSEDVAGILASRPSGFDNHKVFHKLETPHKFLPYSQPTCAICLDDFEAGSTPIRELPCGHIFHPDCIDSFLGNNSSLCPMCKKSVLPTGYCPTDITPTMVRRERNLRMLRPRVTVTDEEGGGELHRPRNNLRLLPSTLKRAILHSSSSPGEVENIVPLQHQAVLITNVTNAGANPDESRSRTEVPATLNTRLSRQELAQQRMRELTSPQTFSGELEVIDTQQRPKCNCPAILLRFQN